MHMRRIYLIAFIAVVSGWHQTANAQLSRQLSEPARIDLTRPDDGPGTFRPSQNCQALTSGPAALKRIGGEVSLTLDITWTDPGKTSIYNPLWRTLGEPERDPVKLRSYNGCLTGPVVEVLPGQTVRWTLNNKLGETNNGPCPGATHTQPNCFNSTNLHTHGLHVSPAGNGDNVFINLPPGNAFQYEHNIPADHPAGTFWYHAHRHGSTAIQVSSSMAGALIVRGRRTIQHKRAGRALVADIDTILRARGGRPLQERILVFQQIAYGCFDPANPTAQPSTRPGGNSWNCPKDFIGEVRGYGQLNGPRIWDTSGRFTSINGEVLPRLGRDPATGVGEPVIAGDIMRWRMVHGGVRDAVPLQIVKVDPVAALQVAQSLKTQPNIPGNIRTFAERAAPAATRAPNIEALQQLIEATSKGARADSSDPNEDVIKQLCRSSTSVPQVELAADGLTRSSLVAKPYNVLQPGYRSDVLVAFPEPGLYCVLGLSIPAAARPIAATTGEPAAQKPQDILMTVRVDPGRTIPARYAGKAAQYVLDEILAADQTLPENRRLPADVATRIGGNDLSDYAFKVEFNAAAGPERNIGYHVRQGPSGLKFVWNASANRPQPEGEDFSYGDAKAPVFEPRLETIETWKITSTTSHIHHIHVNPFQIVDIMDSGNKSIFAADGMCATPPNETGSDADVRQYCDQKGVFRDTIFVRAGFNIVVKTRYERYIGAFVLHCHILDHEDQGMMADVRILAPGEASMPATPHAHR